MVSRFVETLKTTPVGAAAQPVDVPHDASHTAVWLFVRDPATLDAAEQEDLAAFRQASPTLATTYLLVQDFFQMLRQREGERLDVWLAQVSATPLPELHRFAHGVEQDKKAVIVGLTLSINNAHTEGQVTKIKLIKRIMYGRAKFPLLRQRVLHAL
jgi:transposase